MVIITNGHSKVLYAGNSLGLAVHHARSGRCELIAAVLLGSIQLAGLWGYLALLNATHLEFRNASIHHRYTAKPDPTALSRTVNPDPTAHCEPRPHRAL